MSIIRCESSLRNRYNPFQEFLIVPSSAHHVKELRKQRIRKAASQNFEKVFQKIFRNIYELVYKADSDGYLLSDSLQWLLTMSDPIAFSMDKMLILKVDCLNSGLMVATSYYHALRRMVLERRR